MFCHPSRLYCWFFFRYIICSIIFGSLPKFSLCPINLVLNSCGFVYYLSVLVLALTTLSPEVFFIIIVFISTVDCITMLSTQVLSKCL